MCRTALRFIQLGESAACGATERQWLAKELAKLLGEACTRPLLSTGGAGRAGAWIVYSKVLPMAFINSVAIAQHLHRRIVARALDGQISSSNEIHRDAELPRSKHFFRVCLDNFDELMMS